MNYEILEHRAGLEIRGFGKSKEDLFYDVPSEINFPEITYKKIKGDMFSKKVGKLDKDIKAKIYQDKQN